MLTSACLAMRLVLALSLLDTLLGVGFPAGQAEGLIEDYAHYWRCEASAIAEARARCDGESATQF